MSDSIYIIFGTISLTLAVISIIYSRFIYAADTKSKGGNLPLFSRWQVCAIGIFIAVVSAFLPILFSNYTLNFLGILSSFVLSFYHTVRVFLLTLDIDNIKNMIQGCSEEVRQIYIIYMSLVTLCAPIMTAGVILTLFKSFLSELRFRLNNSAPHYIMSELNSYSAALASSVEEAYQRAMDKYKALPMGQRLMTAAPRRPVIVFTGTNPAYTEQSLQHIAELRRTEAICLKRSITDVGIASKGDVKFFLIGYDESENAALAIRLTEAYKDRCGVAIYVYAESEECGRLMDSTDKGSLLINPELAHIIRTDAAAREAMLSDDEAFWKGAGKTALMGNFTLRRIKTSENLALSTLEKAGIFGLAKQDGYISILILGLGRSGRSFLKTALWYCQLEGIKLEINVMDKGISSREKDDLVALLAAEAPEVVSINPSSESGDANYDIAFIPDIDCATAALDKAFDDPVYAARLGRTQLAFVALGDDDFNISASVRLRQIFDRKAHRSNSEVPKFGAVDFPQIYAVVFDDKKAENLNIRDFDSKGRPTGTFVKNYKSQPYFIEFIGSLSEQYSYDAILGVEAREGEAFRQHLSWVAAERRIRAALSQDEDFRKYIADAIAPEAISDIQWGSSYLVDNEDNINTDNLLGEVSLYANFEYYRLSSLSRAVHKGHTAGLFMNFDDDHKDSFVCMCAGCERRRVTEHMRWNAYMRAMGYVRGERKNDRGRIHQDIRPWGELPVLERFKD